MTVTETNRLPVPGGRVMSSAALAIIDLDEADGELTNSG